jgi:O-antigen ligase
VHAHSMPLQALVEGGALAMLAWMLVFLVVPMLGVLFWARQARRRLFTRCSNRTRKEFGHGNTIC